MNNEDDDARRALVMEAIGAASMCWGETPSGVFDSDRALAIGEKLLLDLSKLEVKP